MDTVYIIALWGPVIAIFVMGVFLLLGNSHVGKLAAVATPFLLAGIEAVIVATVVGDNGSINAKESELIPLLMVQVFMLSIVGLVLFAIMLIAWQYDKPPKKMDEPEEYPCGYC